MKTLTCLLFLAVSLFCHAATTTDPANKYAYGANIGWINAYADGANGAVIGDYYCMGHLYAANVGWINLGNGSPANGIQYQNNSASDFGVNQDGLGNLRGYAWGANIGWINFENTGAPKVDLLTGKLSGYAYSANCGWISLSNAVAYVQTDYLYPGPLAPNGLPIPWLLTYFGTTNVNANADPTGKGMTIAQDYVAGTDPNDVNSVLRITAENFAANGTNAMLTWTSVLTRLYHIQETLSLSSPNWYDSSLGVIAPDGTSTMRTFAEASAPDRFYRISAVIPLQMPGAPTLSISHAGSTITVYWRDIYGWTLQQNNNLTSAIGWTTSPGITSSNGTNYLSITPPTGNLFFRLKNQ